MKRIIIALAAISLTAMSSEAQNLRFGGSILNHDLMMAGDFAALSQTQNLGTARSTAMGGAFASLGADMASMSINPAGMGMYRRSEFSITPLLSISKASTEGAQAWQGNNKTRFSLANIGVAINVFESSSSKLTSLTLGFGMNRIADFNTRYSYSSESRYDPSSPDRLMPTIADVFGQQLGQAGIFPDSQGSLGYDRNPYFWPAVLGYNAFMISAPGGEWVPDTIGRNASVLHSTDVVNAGSINEFSLSLGGNISNYLYFGATLGIQSVYKTQDVIYQEEYGYFNTNGVAMDKNGNPLIAQLDYMNLRQKTSIDGGGVNLKLGLIARPVAGLRLGVAYHTPTYYWFDYAYRGDIESVLYNNETEKSEYNTDATPVQEDTGSNSWQFASPSRLMFGASYTFGNFAILSVDYERAWYNAIRVKDVPNGADLSPENYKAQFKTDFRPTNTVRAGLEVRPLPMFALRVGGGYSTSMFRDASLFYNAPLPTESYYITAGLGVNLSRSATLDLSYQNSTNKQTAYQLFFSEKENGEWMTDSGFYDTKYTRHFVSLTLGFRF